MSERRREREGSAEASRAASTAGTGWGVEAKLAYVTSHLARGEAKLGHFLKEGAPRLPPARRVNHLFVRHVRVEAVRHLRPAAEPLGRAVGPSRRAEPPRGSRARGRTLSTRRVPTGCPKATPQEKGGSAVPAFFTWFTKASSMIRSFASSVPVPVFLAKSRRRSALRACAGCRRKSTWR